MSSLVRRKRRSIRIGIVDGRGLDPRAHSVATAELFGLPRAQRFQAVGGHDKRDAEELFRQESGHRNIPRMRVDDVDLRDRNHLRQVQAHGFESSFELLLRAFADEPPGLGAAHVQVAMVGSLIAPAMHLHFDFLRQFAAQVFHMHTGSAVDIRRVFARHQAHSHNGNLGNSLWHPIAQEGKIAL